MSNVGYLNVELEALQLSFAEDPVSGTDAELAVVTTMEIIDSTGVFKWVSGGEVSVASAELKPFRKPLPEVPEPEAPVEGEAVADAEASPAPEGDEAAANADADADAVQEPVKPNTVYNLGFKSFLHRTQYIDLDDSMIDALANASVKITVSRVTGAEGEEKESAELASVTLPASSVLIVPGCTLNGTAVLTGESVVSTTTADIDGSTVSWRMFGDNNLAECVIGCTVVQWPNSELAAPPAVWGMTYEDVIDPKAKVPATDEELRAKYLEVMPGLVETQGTLCSYSLTIGTPAEPPAAVAAEGDVPADGAEDAAAAATDDATIATPTPEPSLLPCSSLQGTIAWNADMAAAVSAEDDIRARGELWSLSFKGQGGFFLSRSRKRELLNKLNGTSGNGSTTIPVTLKKTPLEDGTASGDSITATGTIDLALLLSPGKQQMTFNVSLDGEGFGSADASASSGAPVEGGEASAETKEQVEGEEGEAAAASAPKAPPVPPTFVVSINLSAPLVTSSKVTINTIAPAASTQSIKVGENRDVLAELKVEITNAVRGIAAEYLALYPADSDTGHPTGFDDRKVEFLHYLSTSGAYHAMKESLKPKIQRVVRSQYGVRGQALEGKAEVEVNAQLLSSLYVFLVKQCNHVLNAVFTNTVIDKDDSDINNGGSIVDKAVSVDDQGETVSQKLLRLLDQAKDCENDGRGVDAEQRYLERLQIVKNDPISQASATVRGGVYIDLANYYLRESSRNGRIQAFSASTSDENSAENAKILAEYNAGRAREALQVAVVEQPDKWASRQLLSCLLHEAGQVEEACNAMQRTINTQLEDGANASPASNIASFSDDDFVGYDSDKISPVDPLSYAVLGCHFSNVNKPLQARKALRLAVKSFEANGCTPDVSQHGMPRRTYVLVLSTAAVYLAGNGFVTLSQEALKLAKQCEEAANKVASSREETSVTSPHIRFALKQADAEVSMLVSESASTAGETADDSVLCSSAPEDQINGLLTSATAAAVTGDAMKARVALHNAIGLAVDNSIQASIGPKHYSDCAKKLLAEGKTQEALEVCYTALHEKSTSSMNLLAAICLLRSDRVADAEVALRDANLLDNRNCEVWAYQALLCLTCGFHRLPEAEAALQQTIRLGLCASPILRELATAFIAMDKLQTAEDLIRRALASEGNKGSSYTRKLLGDVLAGQQQAASAVNEYQAILDDEYSENPLKLQAAEQCFALLNTLGRKEEANTVAEILRSLKA